LTPELIAEVFPHQGVRIQLPWLVWVFVCEQS
jgi:hypothetical protein